MLAKNAWDKIQGKFGPHSVVLMSLDSNVINDEFGKPLEHSTPHPTPFSAGVNVFSRRLENEEDPYVFPPFDLIFPLLKFLKSTGIMVCTMVVPLSYPNPIWWPFLLSCRHESLVLGRKGDKNVLLVPLKQGFTPDTKDLVWDLEAFYFKCFYFIDLGNWKFSKN